MFQKFKRHSIFISYRRADNSGLNAAVVGRIYDRLATQYGRDNVFMDVDTIPIGEDFPSFLSEAIQKSSALLLIIGPQWSQIMAEREKDAVDYVLLELETAINKSIPILPVLIGNTRMPRESDLPDSIKCITQSNAFVLDPGGQFHDDLDHLIRFLDQDLFKGKRSSWLTAVKPSHKLPIVLSEKKIMKHLLLGGTALDDVGKRLITKFAITAMKDPSIRTIAKLHSISEQDICLIYGTMILGLMPNPAIQCGPLLLVPTLFFLEPFRFESLASEIQSRTKNTDSTATRYRTIQQISLEMAKGCWINHSEARGEATFRIVEKGGLRSAGFMDA